MIKVLIAEDEEGILYSISNAFSWENMGCEIIGLAQNGIQALEYSLSTPPDRSEERRVGKECASKCRSRWSPYH